MKGVGLALTAALDASGAAGVAPGGPVCLEQKDSGTRRGATGQDVSGWGTPPGIPAVAGRNPLLQALNEAPVPNQSPEPARGCGRGQVCVWCVCGGHIWASHVTGAQLKILEKVLCGTYHM